MLFVASLALTFPPPFPVLIFICVCLNHSCSHVHQVLPLAQNNEALSGLKMLIEFPDKLSFIPGNTSCTKRPYFNMFSAAWGETAP